MKWITGIAFLIAVCSCGGKLTDEQKQRIRQDMKEGEIRKVTEAEFIEAAFAYGRNLKKMIGARDSLLVNKQFTDSLDIAFGVVAGALEDSRSLSEIERQMLVAYQNAPDPVDDNVQRIPGDSILYTWPIVELHKDGTKSLLSVGALRISNKQIILSIED